MQSLGSEVHLSTDCLGLYFQNLYLLSLGLVGNTTQYSSPFLTTTFTIFLVINDSSLSDLECLSLIIDEKGIKGYYVK